MPPKQALPSSIGAKCAPFASTPVDRTAHVVLRSRSAESLVGGNRRVVSRPYSRVGTGIAGQRAPVINAAGQRSAFQCLRKYEVRRKPLHRTPRNYSQQLFTFS